MKHSHFTAALVFFTALMFLALKFNANLSMTTLICAVLLGAFIMLLNNYKIRLSPHIVCLIAMVFAFTLSYAGANFQTNARDSLLMFASAVCGAAFITLLPYKTRQNALLLPVLAGLLIFIMLATATGAKTVLAALPERLNINVNALAGFLVLTFPLSLFFAYKNRARKIFILFAAAAGASVLFTQVLNAILLCTFTLILYFLFIKRKLKASRAVLIFGSALIFCASLISAFWQNAIYFNTAIEIFQSGIFTGAGFGNYGTFFNFYNPNLSATTANNIFFTLLAETGILGTAAFIGHLIVFYFAAAKKAKRGGMHFFVIIAATNFLIFNMSGGSFFTPTNMFFFFLITFYPFKTHALRVKQRAPFYLAAALLLSLLLLLSKPMLANRYSAQALAPFISGDYVHSTLLLEKAVILDPKNPNLLLKLSNSYLAQYQQTKAPEYLFLAISTNKAAIQRYKHSTQLQESLTKLERILAQT